MENKSDVFDLLVPSIEMNQSPNIRMILYEFIRFILSYKLSKSLVTT